MDLVGGIADLIVSAIEVKKSLKELATVSGSDTTELPIDRDMGFVDLDFPEIRERTPAQIFCILVECWLK